MTIPTKNKTGVLTVCIPKEDPVPPTYRVIHDLILSQRICHAPAGTPLYEKNVDACCRAELDAFAAACDAMTKDGMFQGTPVTTDQCAIYFASDACKKTVNALFCSAQTPAAVQTLIKGTLAKNRKNSASCSQAADPTRTVDARITALRQNLANVCNPECRTEYANTIGNTMCYVGQCVEQAFEEHRMIPGRNAFNAGDEAYPFDSCAAPDPSFATLLTPPPLAATWFPAYRPGWLLRTLDNALCQMNGLPPQSAAILCETNALRRLEVPLDNPLENVQSLIDQIVERRRPAEQLERLAPGLGARMGTTLLVNYLRLGGRSLGEITSIAAELLGNLEDIEFPTELCPREGSKTKGLSAHPLCAAIGGSLPPSSAAP